MTQDYNKTINLPKTKFPMRAGLINTEPAKLKDWEDQNLYAKLIEKNKGKPTYILHDGPPYANGSIHLGTAMNKILKDFIIRYKNMSGFCAPFVPGWDTHGLPTELKARKKAKVNSYVDIDPVELRSMCKDFALEYLDKQREQFKRLGVIAEWNNPYITLRKEYEATQIEVFAEMALKGYIYRGLKPVYWCPKCSTALAEAEIEYFDDSCDSIYVAFNVKDDYGILSSKGADIHKTYFVIWTTTTWTLPGNVAICLGSNFTYSLVKAQGNFFVIAKDLLDATMKEAGIADYEVIADFKGKELENIKTKHPFLDRDSLVILGDHVTLESGTGCVHTAPGHGIEDFEVCQHYKELPIVVPVDQTGRLTDVAGSQFKGLTTDEANIAIRDYLKQKNLLFACKTIKHQYPHCWRCKQPVLFRATKQWFCSIEDIKQNVINSIKEIDWLPAWGEDRITSMVRERKDWCISRQRKWGLPIPIVFCEDCNTPLIDKGVMTKVAQIFRQEGSDAWYTRNVEDFLPEKATCPHCGSSKFRKETDIMDVWFDSGVSHVAVLKNRDYLKWPADLYLEGADQYRGWFQSSLLTSIAVFSRPPYKKVISHGWVVDGQGRKMSKSLGNGIDPQEVINKYGADILRLWVASSDYHADVRISQDILKQLSEAYRKIRNTARFILGNICDFVPDEDSVAINDCEPIDKLALLKLNRLIESVKLAYDKFEFYQVYRLLYNFCVVEMSNFYFDVLKDRLYIEGKTSKLRRSAQTVIFIILDCMVKLMAPILCFTADEIWKFMPHRKSDNNESVILNDMPELVDIQVQNNFESKWQVIEQIRNDVLKALEDCRQNKIIGKSLESEVSLHCDTKMYELLKNFEDELATVFIVSKVSVLEDNKGKYKSDSVTGVSITVHKSEYEKCERCWMYSKSVGLDKEHPTLCARCANIIRKQL